MQNLYLVYSSPYGHARRYAEWIAEELGCPCVDRRQADPAQAAACSALLLGGGLYAGGLSGIDFLRKNRDQLREKPIYLFTCGLADPADPQNAAHIRAGVERALPEEMRGRVALFSFRGGIDSARLSRVHRAMMAALAASLRHRDPASLRQEDRDLLATYGKAVEFCDRASIAPLVAAVRADLGLG